MTPLPPTTHLWQVSPSPPPTSKSTTTQWLSSWRNWSINQTHWQDPPSVITDQPTSLDDDNIIHPSSGQNHGPLFRRPYGKLPVTHSRVSNWACPQWVSKVGWQSLLISLGRSNSRWRISAGGGLCPGARPSIWCCHSYFVFFTNNWEISTNSTARELAFFVLAWRCSLDGHSTGLVAQWQCSWCRCGAVMADAILTDSNEVTHVVWH